MQVAHQMGHSKIETTKNIYGHLWAQDRASILDAMNQAVSRLHVYESQEPKGAGGGMQLPERRLPMGCPHGLWGQLLARSGDRPLLAWVGDTGIEPVTSTVSR